MYCSKCGIELPDNSKFCAECGTRFESAINAPVYPAPPYPNEPYISKLYPHKNEAVSLVLGVLIPGLGHIYIGKIMRGILFLVGYLALNIVAFALFWNAFGDRIMSGDLNFLVDISSDLIIPLSMIGLAIFIVWMMNLVDVYHQTEKYNEAIRLSGKAPW